jgi:hypothetical protein
MNNNHLNTTLEDSRAGDVAGGTYDREKSSRVCYFLKGEIAMTVEKAKKNELNSGSAAKTQYIKPFFLNDASVIKKTDAEGNVNYYKRQHPEEEIRACSTDLETDLMCLLEPLEIIERALTNSEQLAFANTLTKTRQNISNAIHEMFCFINNNIGEINITGIYELEIGSICRWGQVVDAKLAPPDEFEQKTIFDHDPELIESLKQISPDKTENLRTVMRILSDGGSIYYRPTDNGKSILEIRK